MTIFAQNPKPGFAKPSLASQRNSPETIIAGAGVRLRRILPHPIGEADGEITICDGRQGIILNVFTEPEWRRRGIAVLLMNTIIEWSREQRLDGLVLHASDEGRALCTSASVSSSQMRCG